MGSPPEKLLNGALDARPRRPLSDEENFVAASLLPASRSAMLSSCLRLLGCGVTSSSSRPRSKPATPRLRAIPGNPGSLLSGG